MGKEANNEGNVRVKEGCKKKKKKMEEKYEKVEN